MTVPNKACERLLSPQQEFVFTSLVTAIKRSCEAWVTTEEVAAVGGLTLRQTRRSLRGLRRRGKVGMVYPATRGRYWAPAEDIVRRRLQSRAWDRYE